MHHVPQGNTPTTSPVMSPVGSPGPPPLLPCAAERAQRGAEPASHAGGALLPVIAAVPDVEPFDMFAAQARPRGPGSRVTCKKLHWPGHVSLLLICNAKKLQLACFTH